MPSLPSKPFEAEELPATVEEILTEDSLQHRWLLVIRTGAHGMERYGEGGQHTIASITC